MMVKTTILTIVLMAGMNWIQVALPGDEACS